MLVDSKVQDPHFCSSLESAQSDTKSHWYSPDIVVESFTQVKGGNGCGLHLCKVNCNITAYKLKVSFYQTNHFTYIPSKAMRSSIAIKPSEPPETASIITENAAADVTVCSIKVQSLAKNQK